MKDLMPTIVSKPVSPLAVRIDRRDPRCAKCSYTHRCFHDSFLVLGLNGPFHDVLEVFPREYTLQCLVDPFGSRNVDTFAPVT